MLCGSTIKVATIETASIFSRYQNYFLTLAYKFGQVLCSLDYMEATLRNTIEGWENIMMEMDIKLRAYASRVG